MAWRWRPAKHPDEAWQISFTQPGPTFNSDDWFEVQPLYAHPAPQQGVREKVARIIEPDGWRAFDEEVRDCQRWGVDLNPLPVAARWTLTAASLRKADAIIAALRATPDSKKDPE